MLIKKWQNQLIRSQLYAWLLVGMGGCVRACLKSTSVELESWMNVAKPSPLSPSSTRLMISLIKSTQSVWFSNFACTLFSFAALSQTSAVSIISRIELVVWFMMFQCLWQVDLFYYRVNFVCCYFFHPFEIAMLCCLYISGRSYKRISEWDTRNRDREMKNSHRCCWCCPLSDCNN